MQKQLIGFRPPNCLIVTFTAALTLLAATSVPGAWAKSLSLMHRRIRMHWSLPGVTPARGDERNRVSLVGARQSRNLTNSLGERAMGPADVGDQPPFYLPLNESSDFVFSF